MTNPFAGSIRWKLIVATLAVELAMVGGLVWNGLRLMETHLARQAELRLQEVTELLNASLGPLMAAQDYGSIAEVFRASRHHDGIQYFVLRDWRGRELASDGWTPDQTLPAPQASFDPGRAGPRFDTEIPVTLAGQGYGRLAFGISTEFIAEARQSFIRDSLLIALGAMLLSAAALTLVAFWLTRPLRRLEAASRAISAGDLDCRVAAGTRDEVGQVARAFNRMAAELKHQIGALQVSEARFRGLLDLSTDWYWEQDADFRFTLHRAGRLALPEQYASSPWLGKCRWELPNTLSEAEWAAHRATLEAHRTFRQFEYGSTAIAGTVRHFSVSGEPVYDGAGNFIGYRGTSTEITERKRAELSLRLAANVFGQAREGIVITDADWHIVDVNPMALELTGYTRDDLVGTDLLALLAERRDADFLEAALAALVENGHWRGETQGRRKNGESFPELVTASVVKGAAGQACNYILMFSDITALKEHQQRLESLAHYDALTRLPNRVLLGDRLRLALGQASREEAMVAVAYLDLDGFKPVNDTLGHDAGDLLLVEVANRLRESIRGGDTVARLGGDEFVLLIRSCDFGECEVALQRVLQVISRPYSIKGRPIELSASIGVARFPHDGTDPDSLLRNADQAMYVAKQTGRNRFIFFDSDHDRRVRAHSEQFARLRAALPAGEFVLHYQPKVDMRSGRVIGAEALIRWQSPERGLVPPNEFLPIIDNSDFAIEVGEWVTATALAQMRGWRRLGIDLPVSVNIAARQLQAPDFADRLQALLATYADVPAGNLELEIVETAALEDVEYISGVITRCLAFGVSFALDDFGTGYSSLIYFKRLPAQTLKIDQSFVRDMLVDPEDLAIVEGVIGLARAFSRAVIAEGVETAEHGVRLLALGCDRAQGYGIARPMPADQIPAWVNAFRPDPTWLT